MPTLILLSIRSRSRSRPYVPATSLALSNKYRVSNFAPSLPLSSLFFLHVLLFALRDDDDDAISSLVYYRVDRLSCAADKLSEFYARMHTYITQMRDA